jgi:ribosome-binding protein aMBF1 (putative translation factor)
VSPANFPYQSESSRWNRDKYNKWFGVSPRVTDLGDIFANAVRAERSRRGWRQQDLAEKCGWSLDVISTIERGLRRVAVEDLPVLCGALGVPLIKLLDGADPEDLRKIGLG